MELLEELRREKNSRLKGGIYHKLQVGFAYNSNHIEGSRLTEEQTRAIFETNTIGIDSGTLYVDDILETIHHFRCVDLIIDQVEQPLSESLIKHLHLMLKADTSDSRKEWFSVGDYKKNPNEVGGMVTTAPQNVEREIRALFSSYEQKPVKTLDDVLDFHVRFEAIHPFQDGNGRVGRLILLKECLRYGIVPFIIDDNLKMFYYRGLREWKRERGYLRDTCLTAQDRFKTYLDYFEISYAD